MNNESLQHHEAVSHRGNKFKIWRTSIDHGRGKPIERRWYVETHPGRWFEYKAEAVAAGRYWINYLLDGDLALHRLYSQMEYPFDEPEEIAKYHQWEPAEAREENPQKECVDALRGKLENVTIERGYAPAEVAAAKRRLSEKK